MSTKAARKSLADEIDRIDAEIEALNEDKKSFFTAYRDAHGKVECRATKAAIKRRQKYAAGKAAEIEEHDALTDQVFMDITAGTGFAITRAPRSPAVAD